MKILKSQTFCGVYIMVLLLTGSHAKCPDRMYILFDDAGKPVDCKPCWDCLAGHNMTSPCTSSSNSVCKPCADGYFNPGLSNYCSKCKHCPRGTYFVGPCTKISDTNCTSCTDGYFSDMINAKACTSCSTCSAYEKIVTPCNKTSDTTCTCSDVAYRDKATGKCLPCCSCTGKTSTIVAECEQKIGRGGNICQFMQINQEKQRLDEKLEVAYNTGVTGLMLAVVSITILVFILLYKLSNNNQFKEWLHRLKKCCDNSVLV